MIITNKIGFTISVILGVLLVLFLIGKLLIWIAESQPEVPGERTSQEGNFKPQQQKPEYTKGKGDGCGQFIILIGATILLIMALIG